MFQAFIWKIYHESDTAQNRQDPALYSDFKKRPKQKKGKK